MQIAILLDQHGVASRFSDSGTIYVFEKREEMWISERKFNFSSRNYTSMSELRSYVVSIVQWLGDCKVFAARRSNGYYRVLLEGYGVGLWAVEGIPQHFITQIESFYRNNLRCDVTVGGQDVGSQDAAMSERQQLIIPIPHKTGFYRVDLRDVMAHKTTLNSKELLLPFFKETPFRQLEIICDRVPCWFKSELSILGLWANIESSGKEQIKIVIVPAKK
jgi:Fe-only nitrogenase accessory protein AnfO